MKKTLLTCLLATCLTAVGYSQTTFVAKQTIDANTGNNPYTIGSGLIDNDAYIDILVGLDVDNVIVWYKNNGDGTFTEQAELINTLNYIGGLKLVDLNNDGFLDVLATGYTNDKVVWFANDGLGNFGTEQVISSTTLGASGIAVGTIDVGPTIDVAITSYDGNNVVWFSNDGSGVFTGPNTIDNTLLAPGSVQLKDIDGDTDLDAIITTAQFAGPVDVAEIFRNDGAGVFTKDATSVTTGKNYIFNASFEDLDGDSNLDILLTELNVTAGAGNFYWIEEDGAGGYIETAFTTTIGNPSVAQHRDLDDDGDKDIILSSGTSGAGNDIVWYLNDGSGNYSSEVIIDATQSQAYVFTVNDLDNDGDLDIASCAFNQDDLNWFENEKYSLSTNTVDINAISFYPNPATNKLYFRSNYIDTFKIEVYDILGKNVMSSEISIENNALDISKLMSGLYILKLQNVDLVYKFIKE